MYDMTIRLQQNSEVCLYEQIYEHIRQEIREGKLLAGERLPSTRSLAEYLQVSRSTVDYAYDQLLSEGYIEARPYKGYFVCATESLLDMEKEVSEKGEKIGEVQDEKPEFVYDFSPHGIDMSAFPFSVWKRIHKNILTDANSDLFARGEPQGDLDLRTTICRYLHSSRGVKCSPEQIIVGAGNDYLLMLLEKILGHHVGVAMENPTYMRTWKIFNSFAYPVTIVPSDESGMKASALEKTEAKVAYIMPSHQFPLGTVMPIGRRVELLNWANRGAGRFLIEDDYDSEFRYRGKPIPALQSLDEFGKVIYIGTFSKAIAPAIRVSYMVLPNELLQKYLDECSFYSCTVSRIDQRILNEFIEDGYFERHLNKMRKIYRTKHEVMLRKLEPFLDKFTLTGTDGGLHVLLQSCEGTDEQMLIGRAAENGVKVYGISESCVEPVEALRGMILLGFGSMDEAQIIDGIERLKKAWLSQ